MAKQGSTSRLKPSEWYRRNFLMSLVAAGLLIFASVFIPFGAFLLPFLYFIAIPILFISAILWLYHSVKRTPASRTDRVQPQADDPRRLKKNFLISGILFLLPGPLTNVFLSSRGEAGTEFIALIIFPFALLMLVATIIYGIAFIFVKIRDSRRARGVTRSSGGNL